MTRIAWACLWIALGACAVAWWNFTQAENSRRIATEAVELTARAVETATIAGAVADAENKARLWCKARGRPIVGFQIQYADDKPARVAVLCSQELRS
jgi:hypothetical protein